MTGPATTWTCDLCGRTTHLDGPANDVAACITALRRRHAKHPGSSERRAA